MIDTGGFGVTRSERIRATPERVWAAPTCADVVAQWFGNPAVLPDLFS